jgi:hypothetical protein
MTFMGETLQPAQTRWRGTSGHVERQNRLMGTADTELVRTLHEVLAAAAEPAQAGVLKHVRAAGFPG